jgi:hypothetical protein
MLTDALPPVLAIAKNRRKAQALVASIADDPTNKQFEQKWQYRKTKTNY